MKSQSVQCEVCGEPGRILRVGFIDKGWMLFLPSGTYEEIQMPVCPPHSRSVARYCMWQSVKWGWVHPWLMWAKPFIVARLLLLRIRLRATRRSATDLATW